MENNNSAQCLFCKITSICCLCGIGGYLIHVSKSHQDKNSRMLLILLGAGSIALGIGEIFDKSPFRNYEK